jgi:hypothetical protein
MMGSAPQSILPGMTVTPSPFPAGEFACAVCRKPHRWLVMRQACCDAMPVCSRCLHTAKTIADRSWRSRKP